jgi:hypothetical protein
MHSTRSRNARLRHTVVCRLRRATSALRDDGQTLDAISAGAGDVVLVGLLSLCALTTAILATNAAAPCAHTSTKAGTRKVNLALESEALIRWARVHREVA